MDKQQQDHHLKGTADKVKPLGHLNAILVRIYAIESHFYLTSYILNRTNNLLMDIKTQCQKLLKQKKQQSKLVF